MKRFLVLLTIMALILSLAACGSSKKDEPAGGEPASASDVQPSETDELAEVKLQLIGDWHATNWPPTTLSLHEDGKGTFVKQDGTAGTLEYEVYSDEKQYNNGQGYADYMMKLSYSTDESEEIIFWFNENGTMGFHNSENGGYGGFLGFSEWAKD